jgi:hypothetical protein
MKPLVLAALAAAGTAAVYFGGWLAYVLISSDTAENAIDDLYQR